MLLASPGLSPVLEGKQATLVTGGAGGVSLLALVLDVMKAFAYRYKPYSPITLCFIIRNGVFYICHFLCFISQLVQNLGLKNTSLIGISIH